jgi:hypothetical protein
MFLRKLHVHKDGQEYGYWSLVETVRTADGPRQRTICYLGELNDSTHARWQKTVEVFNEHGESTQLKLFPSEAEASDDPNVARVLVKKVLVERTRRFGDCYLGLELWKRLGLEEFFARHLDGDGADVTTVEAILRTVERKHGKARRVWILDRGVVSEENLWRFASVAESIWSARRAASSSNSRRSC